MNNKLDKRDVILDAAKELFTAKGFDGTSVFEIAKKANLSKASLYYYYTSKDEILYELIKRTLKNTMVYIKEDCNTEYLMSAENTDRLTNRVLEFIEKEKDVFKIALIEDLKNNSNESMIFGLLDSIFKEYDNAFELVNEDKAKLFILSAVFVISLSLNDKISDNFSMDNTELEKVFKLNINSMFQEIIKNLKARV